MLVAAGCCAGAYLQLLALLATALVALLLGKRGCGTVHGSWFVLRRGGQALQQLSRRAEPSLTGGT